jgi:REP element-mobilizing transposase RayT
MEEIIEINVGATLAVAQSHDPETPSRDDATANANTNAHRATARVAPTKIGRIIGAYKSLVFTKCLEISNQKKYILGKLWQRNYWEHIIRNETEYARIVEYIRNNPILWGKKHLNEILPQT